MNKGWIDSLVGYFSKSDGEPSSAPEGACANCWGHYEYESAVRKMVRDEQVDVQNHETTRSFIEEFVVQHVDGARLRNQDGAGHCEQCGKSHSGVKVHD